MKPIIILLVCLISSPSIHLGDVLPDSRNIRHISQDKQTPPVIDEIFAACGPLFFQPRSSHISDEGEKCLLEISLMSQRASNYYVVIDGHRDSSERRNLSRIRAKKARDYSVQHNNVNSSRLILRDFGDTCPHETGDKGLNGRVEFRYWREDREIEPMLTRCAPGAKPRFGIIK